MDDASNMKIMFKVMMPMAKPALVTIGLLSFISTWNNYFWPLIMTSSETLRTLPVGVAAPEILRDAADVEHYHGRKRSAGTADSDCLCDREQKDPEFLYLFRY